MLEYSKAVAMSFSSRRKGDGKYVNLQILAKASPPGLSLDIGTFCLFDFAAFLNYKNFNTVMA